MQRSTVTRRRFLADSGRLAAAAGVVSLWSADALPGQDDRTKKNLCLSCRDAHLRQTGEKDCWAALRSIGAEGVEATIGEDLGLPELFHTERKYSAAGEGGIERLMSDMKAAGCRISAFCMYNRFDERPDFEVEWGTKAARAAKALGVAAIRIDLWPHKLSATEFLDFSVTTMKKLMEATEDTGVAFGIENHGTVTNNPEFLRPLFDRVGSKRLGLTLDTGNFYWFGHPLAKVYELFALFAQRVCHTHCKSIKYPEDQREKRRTIGWEYGKYNCPIDQGDIDFARVIKILRGADYAGDLCVEDESLGKFPAGERGKVLAREIAYLRRLR